MLDPRLSVDWIFLLWCCVSCLNFFTEISFPSKLNANFTFLWAKSGKPWWNFYIAISFDLFEIIWILAVDWARLSHLQEIFTEKPYLIKHIPKFRCFAMDIVMLPPPAMVDSIDSDQCKFYATMTCKAKIKLNFTRNERRHLAWKYVKITANTANDSSFCHVKFAGKLKEIIKTFVSLTSWTRPRLSDPPTVDGCQGQQCSLTTEGHIDIPFPSRILQYNMQETNLEFGKLEIETKPQKC